MKKYILFLLTLFVSHQIVLACSSAVISGKITPDGRPLLWKHRDTDFLQNSVAYFAGERFSFIAIVNSVDDNPDEIWIGTNSVGFSLMNTQSYNLMDMEKGEERGPANGRVMRRALEVCASVNDFRHFLDTLSKPSFIEANFGVIDASGGASMFEVDYYKYVEFDANKPQDAPYGYIARTNYSFSGKVNEGGGYVRFMQEDRILMPAAAMNIITPAWIFSELSRSFRHGLLDIDLKSGEFNRPKTSGWFIDNDFIPRKSTASSVVIQGVKPGEPAELTTMWTVLGYPPVSVAVPVWVKGSDRKMPVLLARDIHTKVSPLCDKAIRLMSRVFSYKQGMGSSKYMNWELLHNPGQTGYMQILEPVEKEVFKRCESRLSGWRNAGTLNTKEVYQLYEELDKFITEKYRELFGSSE